MAWAQAFGYRPLLAETFTDIERFRGTCYKACGWIEAGESHGFARDALDFYVPHGNIKRLWLKGMEHLSDEALEQVETLVTPSSALALNLSVNVLRFLPISMRPFVPC